MTAAHIERVTDATVVQAAADLFDSPPLATATARFLASPDHHLLLARDLEGTAVGMVTGVETTHPDKGTEMFVYELGVAPAARRRGIATALLRALAELAQERGCYGMWVAVDSNNVAALALYARVGALDDGTCAVLGWSFSTDSA
ncbi:MAG: GNAT family N-acetyltransferase [Nakamurella sp.]